VKQEVYLEATNIPVNLSNWRMEELDMIKRCYTLLQENTTNIMLYGIKKLKDISKKNYKDLAAINAANVFFTKMHNGCLGETMTALLALNNCDSP
jgi:hypothetical protein